MREIDTVAKRVEELWLELDITLPEETPIAVARALLDLTSGYKVEPKVKRDFPICFDASGEKQTIEFSNIRFYSLCEHHLLPFFGFVHIAYVPDKVEIGFSKPARFIEHFSKKPQVQERLTKEILSAIYECAEPLAVVVESEAVHLCSVMRGVRTPDEVVKVRQEKVDQIKYKYLSPHTKHIVKDMLHTTFKSRQIMRFL